jgi:Flp pilus assembly protein TadG
MSHFSRMGPGTARNGRYQRGCRQPQGAEPWLVELSSMRGFGLGRDEPKPVGPHGRDRGEPPIRRLGQTRSERGSAVVEFALVAPLAILVALAVTQFALFLYERNVVMGSLSEGVRVAASTDRSISDGQLAAARLLRESLGRRISRTVLIRGTVEDGLAVLRTDATLPSFVPGMPGLEVHMTAAMHKEDELPVTVEARAPLDFGATASSGGAPAPGGPLTPEVAAPGAGKAGGEGSVAAPADGPR